ncbi:MAG: TraR/DksA family transcriptional regulator [Desulfuromonadaceae bacterium]|nr:TraR/DksA family transcriptional regulator [Desulfuromonadaceae bacterium]MDD2849568.1 TraR/DksA family transcriptional regulator [Desulfuromonadaceae bacterium]MDD4131994.1 TraR/DksA family transcriptional regulator [Desulfuromonadaceae bacterium]
MATITKATKESTSKAEKAAPSASIAGKKSATKAEKAVEAAKESSTDKTVDADAKAPVAKSESAVSEASSPVKPLATQDQKWQEIRMILEKLKEDTLREIRKSVKKGTEAVAAIEPGGDIYDQASSERDRELGLLLGDREREKIHSIDEALLRIDEGEYGICEECDEDIPLGRLKAMPFTRHCVKCKSDLEKLQAQTKRVEEERAYREIPLGSEEEES